MIIVDVNVFILDKFYDFELNEDAKVKEVIEEIVHMVEQKEKTAFTGDIKDMILVDNFRKDILNPDYTLAQQGIDSGWNLSLV
ncbi:EsaB/YukD family protein [Lachnoanaerobaculum gingivalis]|jgi:hypothetical protein|uniref:Glutamyl-tRNA amidotransferase n=1 Tax=Lachnoanaerobaculum gingivalis TaxID=2490855 RepID=A0A3P3QTI9_9FIRM|nr:EsaB/YukD family protein [Lachnoanaerobaculum gingivalis]MDU6631097.1 EsaB/YukD family protein [Lachnoanaerobaculum sp.]RKW44099.1 MAG: glutamyl-tRNA amidotransferase [Lachnospiraceae bacterium]RRJ24542.1 glutamyl-tRNA amidotransferase [Lachnoanaerobaculum gingivalis]